MMFYKSTKVKVRLPDGDTDFFDIVAGVLQEETLAPYLFIIYQDYVLRTSIDLIKENSFTLKKGQKQTIPRRNNYSDDIVLLSNTPALAESLLHSLEQVAGGIILHVNTDKTEHMCFNRKEDISTPNGGSLKLLENYAKTK